MRRKQNSFEIFAQSVHCDVKNDRIRIVKSNFSQRERERGAISRLLQLRKPKHATHQHFVARELHVRHHDSRVAVHRRFQCRLVYHVLKVGARASGGAASHLVNVHLLRHFHFAHVVLKNVAAAFQIWRKHLHLHVKSTGTQQRSASKHTQLYSPSNGRDIKVKENRNA